MKLRTGFVSNSSSSSFVILLPEGFGPTELKKLYESHKEEADEELENQEIEYKDVEKAFKSLLKEKFMYEEESYAEMSILNILLEDYVVNETSVDSSSGSMSLLDMKKVKKIMEVK